LPPLGRRRERRDRRFGAGRRRPGLFHSPTRATRGVARTSAARRSALRLSGEGKYPVGRLPSAGEPYAFALLGLRALFFLVAGAVARFAYLQYGLGVLLIAIAAKLAYGEATGEKVPTSLTLGAIVAVLTVAIGASVARERRSAASDRR
jgi:hypothetical protein